MQQPPAGYIVRNDGLFGEWNAWRDDDLGTFVANGCASREEAVEQCQRDAENVKTLSFTAFCQMLGGNGTIWIDKVEVPIWADDILETAVLAARQTCAKEWERDPDEVHCLGLAKGDIEILYWEDQ